MQTEIIIAGFGGQGVLFAGKVLAYAGMAYDKCVTWIPSYGPEMRGGTANVTVIIGDEEIGSPLVKTPDMVLAFNNPSLEKYEMLVKSGGNLIYNASLITPTPQRDDITYIPVLANSMATELGNPKLVNMVMVGAALGSNPLIPLETVCATLKKKNLVTNIHLLHANQKALELGAALVTNKVFV